MFTVYIDPDKLQVNINAKAVSQDKAFSVNATAHSECAVALTLKTFSSVMRPICVHADLLIW